MARPVRLLFQPKLELRDREFKLARIGNDPEHDEKKPGCCQRPSRAGQKKSPAVASRALKVLGEDA
jgi:hypothetical protein